MLTAHYEYSLKSALKVFNLALLIGGSLVYAEDFLKSHPAQVLPGEIINFDTTSSYHFEMAAPQKCADLAPVAKSPRRISCRFTDKGEKQISLSVCDNAKTFCKPTLVKIRVEGEAKGHGPRPPSSELAAAQKAIKQKIVPGFEFSSPSEVLAASERLPVLVMVSTDWCPPCNDMKENVLSTQAFAEAAKGWRKVYVDGDSTASAEWNKIAPFYFFPTFIALDANLKEVSRYWGPTRLHDFKQWLEQAKNERALPIEDLRLRVQARKNGSIKQRVLDFVTGADKNNEARRLLKWSLLAQDKAGVALWPQQEVPEELMYFWYRYHLATAQNPTDSEQIELMNGAVKYARGTSIFIEELVQLCGTDLASCKTWAPELPARYDWLEKQTYVAPNEKAAAIGQEASYHVQIYKTLGDEAKTKTAAEKCVKASEEEAKASPLGLPRAANIYLSYCLESAGREKDAERVYKELVTAYPNESTFLLRYGNFFKRQKRYKEALVWADRAVQAGYGYNWLKAINLKVDAEIALNDKAAALKTIRAAISELDLTSKNSSERDQRWVAHLRALEKKVTATKS